MPAQAEVATATSAPRIHEIRRSASGRTFYVQGDAGSGANDHDGYRYTEPHTALIEVAGKSAGCKFAVPTRMVAEWEVITPDPFDPLGGALRGVGRCSCPCGKSTDPGCPVHP